MNVHLRERHIISIIILGLLAMAFSLQTSYGQTCASPNTVFTTSSTDALCLGAGSVTVSNVTGGSGTYEYQLVNAGNPGLNKPWQTSATFSSVSSGTYEVQVRSTCTVGTTVYSSVVTQPVIVGGNYQTINLQVSTTPTCSNDGTITTTATLGYLNPGSSYRYALVPSLAEPEPISSYVRPQQTSNLFTGLTPGTYYVRVYDDCSSYASYRTIQAIVTSSAITAPTVYVNRYLSDCNSEKISINASTVPGTLTFIYPDGSEEALSLTQSNVISVTSAKFGTGNPASTFYVKYEDLCGNVTSTPYTYDELNYRIQYYSLPGAGCNTKDWTFYIQPYSTAWPSMSNYGEITYTYSIDGGSNQTFTVGPGYIGPVINFPSDGNSHTITLSACGQTFTTTIYTPQAATSLGMIIKERNIESCQGKSGIGITASDYRSISIHFTSVPFGQTPPADQTATLILIPNLLPGNYTFTVTDGCLMETHSFTLEHPIQMTYQVIEGVRCDEGQSGIDVTVNADFFVESGNVLGYSYQYFDINIYNSSNNVVATQSNTLSYYGNISSFTNHFALSPGTYKIVISNAACANYERTITISGNRPITLDQLLATSFCPTEGFTVVQASGGVGPYQYTLYENAIVINNKLAGPQAGNAFTGLDPNKTYFVAATDQCGAGINIQTQFSTVPLTTALNAESKDCLGEPAQIEVYSLPGATYQWYKDNTLIPGATNPVYSISSLSASDIGEYKAFVTLNTCNAYSTDLPLTGIDCAPFPVKLIAFNAKKEGNIALLSWSTAYEDNSKNFELQHSMDARTWKTEETIKAKGVSTTPASYSYTHRAPQNGTNYYRLKMIDNDGSSALSSIRDLRFELTPAVSIYPNPASDRVRIESVDTDKITSVSMYDLNGRQALSPRKPMNGTVDVKQLSSGTYIIQIKYKNDLTSSHTIRVVR